MRLSGQATMRAVKLDWAGKLAALHQSVNRTAAKSRKLFDVWSAVMSFSHPSFLTLDALHAEHTGTEPLHRHLRKSTRKLFRLFRSLFQVFRDSLDLRAFFIVSMLTWKSLSKRRRFSTSFHVVTLVARRVEIVIILQCLLLLPWATRLPRFFEFLGRRMYPPLIPLRSASRFYEVSRE